MENELLTLLRPIATERNKNQMRRIIDFFNRQESYISQLEMDNFELTVNYNDLRDCACKLDANHKRTIKLLKDTVNSGRR